jgi:transglutaminase-like putative cysteine protease
MVVMVNVHDSHKSAIEKPDEVQTEPAVPLREYRDLFGNRCVRLVAPAGTIAIRSSGVLTDPGEFEKPAPHAIQHDVDDLPDETLPFLLASRYCETELLSQTAWNLFGATEPGWARVQAICDYVHNYISFSYPNARNTRTAWEAWNERTGVCRDFTHLAVTLCRAMNIPARYCTGYLGDMGLPPPYAAMDFAAWFEAYLGGAWRAFDPRNNSPRIARTPVARGRDAADVAIATTFGPHYLESFKVITEEILTRGAG